MKLPFLASIIALALTGCVAGSASEDLTINNTLYFDGSSESFVKARSEVEPLPTETFYQSFPVDVSNVVSKLEKYGNLNVVVDQNTLTGNASFVSHIQITLSNESQSTDLVVCDVDVNPLSQTNSFPVLATGAQLLSYLADGSTNINFAITGTIPTSPIDLQSTIVLTVSDSVSKSL
jgi:hypothetical protein